MKTPPTQVEGERAQVCVLRLFVHRKIAAGKARTAQTATVSLGNLRLFDYSLKMIDIQGNNERNTNTNVTIKLLAGRARHSSSTG